MTVISIRGPFGTAKSTFAATLPGKKYWFDLESGASRALWRFPADNYTLWRPKPQVEWLTHTRGDRVIGQNEKYNTIAAEFIKVLGDKEHQTIVFDTWKELWTTTTQAELQRKQDAQVEQAYSAALGAKPPFQGTLADYETAMNGKINWRATLQPIEYAAPNAKMRNLIYICRQFNKSLILISHERDVYGDIPDGKGSYVKGPTGQMELDGWKETLDQVDWGFAFSQARVKIAEKPIHKFIATIEKSAAGADLVGIQLSDPPIEPSVDGRVPIWSPTWNSLRTLLKLYGRSIVE